MPNHARTALADYASLDDHALVARVLDGERPAFRHIMQRFNQRLFRVARAVIGEDSEAEDVLQESYMSAYRKLDTFRGDSTLLTWLTKSTSNPFRVPSLSTEVNRISPAPISTPRWTQCRTSSPVRSLPLSV